MRLSIVSKMIELAQGQETRQNARALARAMSQEEGVVTAIAAIERTMVTAAVSSPECDARRGP